jgi:hypothetical protein
VRHIDLYGFLKRAGLAKHLHTFLDNGISSAAALIALGKDGTSSLAKTLKSPSDYALPAGDADTLADIITKTTDERGALLKFTLHYRPRVMSTFVEFYRGVVLSSDKSVSEKRVCFTEEDLARYAFEYSLVCCDAKGRALVSLLEIENHLALHQSSPSEAVSSALAELVNPPLPEPPAPAEPRPTPTDWVYVWLAEAGLEDYGSSFLNQAICTKEDLLLGDPFTDTELNEVFGVDKLGHRKKIREMQLRLRQREGSDATEATGTLAGSSSELLTAISSSEL